MNVELRLQRVVRLDLPQPLLPNGLQENPVWLLKYGLTRHHPFQRGDITGLIEGLDNCNVKELSHITSAQLFNAYPLPRMCKQLITNPHAVNDMVEDAEKQKRRFVRDVAEEYATGPVVNFKNALQEELNRRRELESKEEEKQRSGQSCLDAIPSQLNTAIVNSKMILDNTISNLQADREAEKKRVDAEYDQYEAEANQTHDDFVTGVNTSASDYKNMCTKVIVSANDNITQLKEDEKKDLTEAKATEKILTHSFTMLELYGQGETAT